MEYGIKNVFRFYDNKDKQNRYYDYVHGNLRTWSLYSDVYRVLPFQIQVTSGTQASDVVVYLVDPLDDAQVDISSYFTITGTKDLYIETFTSYDYLIYNRNQNLNTAIPQGKWYLKITAGGETFYSEVFSVVDLAGKIIIDYYHTSDVDTIDYTNGAESQYSNKLILGTLFNKPEYIYTEEGIEDGNGSFIPTFRRRAKKYKFVFYAPEYVVDAVSLMPLHDVITVVTDYEGSSTESMTALDFQVADVEWNETKGFAKVTCEFRTGAVVITGCANNVT